jgi:natural product biosynthesis luciferase-like monooxygenase protein
MSNFSAFLIGSESLLVQCAEILLDRGNDVRGVISGAPAIRAWAAQRGVRVIQPGPGMVAELRQEPFDYFFAITHLEMIPEEILDLPRRAAINFHDGPLPRYAGLNATSWALLSGEPTHGITWHVMTQGADEGDLLKQRTFEIAPGETALTLNTKCWEAGIDSFGELADELAEDRAERTPQDLSARTYYGRDARPPAACSISLDQPAESICALVRALDYGAYANPLGIAKLWIGDEPIGVREVERRESTQPVPGTVVSVDESGLRVSTATDDLVLSRLVSADGDDLTAAEIAERAGLDVGFVIDAPGFLDALDAFHSEAVRYEPFWIGRLGRLEPVEVPYARRQAAETEPRFERVDLTLPTSDQAEVAAGVACLLRRLGGKETFRVEFRSESDAPPGPWAAAYRRHVPLRVSLSDAESFAGAVAAMKEELLRCAERGALLREVRARRPELRGLPLRPSVAILQTLNAAGDLPADEAELVFALPADGCATLHFDAAVYRREDAERLGSQLAALLRAGLADPDTPVARLPVQDESERSRVLEAWNDTGSEFDRSRCVHELFAAQAARTPDRDAVVFEGRSLTYAELDAASNRLAHRLRDLGVGPDGLVGLCVERSLDLLVGVLGIQKAGGAYVPLDPAFPRDRLAFMIEDAGVPVLVTQDALRGHLGDHDARVVSLDGDAEELAGLPVEAPETAVRPEHLAYVIYTSGSTGKPKGVQVEHRNVVNFFHGMDGRIEHQDGDVWLAVTSLSFDISVLELLWTLARGFTVVVHSDRAREAATQRRAARTRPIAMSLFYFSADAGENPASKYRLLTEGARFADRNGFNAVWTPERHFHEFGGLYPNPAVTGAAIAALTENVQIRAGSVVLPLHHPARVAEEWSVVDNLSGGRVGISVAAGWQPNDFVLRPESFADAKQVMFREIETLRKLWRGERVTFRGPKGDVSIATLPRPIQAEVPIWVTTAGTLETWILAAEAGCNVLTHLLGQTIHEVGEKVAAYRAAWLKAGHPGKGIVTLMLHTFVSDDDDAIREIVREPMKEYLQTAMSLVQEAAWQFPTFKEKAETSGKSFSEVFATGFTDEERDAVLEFAFERYFETSGLFGTPESCAAMVDRVAGIDVDEIGCLIDFGVPTDTVLGSLKHLARLCAASSEATRSDASGLPEDEQDDHSLPALIRRHRVTNLQCTPSMASMLILDDETRAALGSLQTFLLGGEALPESLAREVASVTKARLVNMYGPTETTIWSTTHEVGPGEGTSSIGRAIANTTLYVVDANLQPMPVGVPGELLIGGEGVVRGYLNRPDLTAERFVPDPFVSGARVYRTGDLVRWGDDGELEFLGRIDHQVKIRGYRIELGEIEARLAAHEAVREAVVVAREDTPGDKRLVAYYLPEAAADADHAALRAHLRSALPEYMVPASFVALDQFPLTPNAKVDRKALPAPEGVRRRGGAVAPEAAPQSDLQVEIAGLWQEALGVDAVGLDDNFFDLGGHSLLAVRVHRDLKERVDRPLSITDLFRLPTVRALSAFLAGETDEGAVVRASEDRAAARRDAMARRRSRRRGRGEA